MNVVEFLYATTIFVGAISSNHGTHYILVILFNKILFLIILSINIKT